jgi:hypothetical protein
MFMTFAAEARPRLVSPLSSGKQQRIRHLAGRRKRRSQNAMLGCARLIRADLPFRKSRKISKIRTKCLRARQNFILTRTIRRKPGRLFFRFIRTKRKILGARTYLRADDSSPANSAYLSALFASVNESLPAAGYLYLLRSLPKI